MQRKQQQNNLTKQKYKYNSLLEEQDKRYIECTKLNETLISSICEQVNNAKRKKNSNTIFYKVKKRKTNTAATRFAVCHFNKDMSPVVYQTLPFNTKVTTESLNFVLGNYTDTHWYLVFLNYFFHAC